MNILERPYSNNIMCLTSDSSDALNRTLTRLISLIKLLLNYGFSKVLAGNFQSDRLEGEFRIYRQSSDGCYYISLQQIINSVQLQGIKLY